MHHPTASQRTTRAALSSAGLHASPSSAAVKEFSTPSSSSSSTTSPSYSAASASAHGSLSSSGALVFDAVDARNDGPGELYGHTLVVHDGRLVVFGGATKAGSFTDILWLFDLGTRMWHSVSPPPAGSGVVVRGRHFHSAVVVGDAMYIFGGKSNGYLNDLLRFDLRALTWSAPEQTGSVPSRRYGHSCVFYDGALWVFGGYDDLGYVSDELFAWHIASGQWRRVTYAPVPPELRLARYQHAACVQGDAMWVFGGRAEQREYFVGDLLHLSFATLSWARVPGKGKPPAPRWGHALLSTGRAFYVLGGSDYVLAFKDVYKYSLHRATWRRVDVDEARGALEPRFFLGAALHDHALYVFAGRNIHHYLYKDVLRAVLDAEARAAPDLYAKQMWTLLVTATFADVQLQFMANPSAPLYAHRGVLSARSEALSAMFRTKMREGEAKGIVIITLPEDEDATAWRHLLYYLYTNAFALPLYHFDDTPVSNATAESEFAREYSLLVELLLLADRYLLTPLKLECARRLKRHVAPTSVVALYSLAERTRCAALLRCTLKRALLWRSLLPKESSLPATLKSYLRNNTHI